MNDNLQLDSDNFDEYFYTQDLYDSQVWASQEVDDKDIKYYDEEEKERYFALYLNRLVFGINRNMYSKRISGGFEFGSDKIISLKPLDRMYIDLNLNIHIPKEEVVNVLPSQNVQKAGLVLDTYSIDSSSNGFLLIGLINLNTSIQVTIYPRNPIFLLMPENEKMVMTRDDDFVTWYYDSFGELSRDELDKMQSNRLKVQERVVKESWIITERGLGKFRVDSHRTFRKSFKFKKWPNTVNFYKLGKFMYKAHNGGNQHNYKYNTGCISLYVRNDDTYTVHIESKDKQWIKEAVKILIEDNKEDLIEKESNILTQQSSKNRKVEGLKQSKQ